VSVLVGAGVSMALLGGVITMIQFSQKAGQGVQGKSEFGALVDSVRSITSSADACKAAFVDASGVAVKIPAPSATADSSVEAEAIRVGGADFIRKGERAGAVLLQSILLTRPKGTSDLLSVQLLGQKQGEVLGTRGLQNVKPLLLQASFGSDGAISSCQLGSGDVSGALAGGLMSASMCKKFKINGKLLVWDPVEEVCKTPCQEQEIVYSTPGAFSLQVPDGCTRVDVVVFGGGGAGGMGGQPNGGSFSSGSGGGGGGFASVADLEVVPGQSYSVVVGAGAPGTQPSWSNTVAASGQESRFANFVAASGGEGGRWNSTAGAGGRGLVGAVKLTGTAGAIGVNRNTGGNGGVATGSGAGSKQVGSSTPNCHNQSTCTYMAESPGSGGAGGGGNNSASGWGAAGGHGRVIVRVKAAAALPISSPASVCQIFSNPKKSVSATDYPLQGVDYLHPQYSTYNKSAQQYCIEQGLTGSFKVWEIIPGNCPVVAGYASGSWSAWGNTWGCVQKLECCAQ
jgi:hypothetical protein